VWGDALCRPALNGVARKQTEKEEPPQKKGATTKKKGWGDRTTFPGRNQKKKKNGGVDEIYPILTSNNQAWKDSECRHTRCQATTTKKTSEKILVGQKGLPNLQSSSKLGRERYHLEKEQKTEGPCKNQPKKKKKILASTGKEEREKKKGFPKPSRNCIPEIR